MTCWSHCVTSRERVGQCSWRNGRLGNGDKLPSQGSVTVSDWIIKSFSSCSWAFLEQRLNYPSVTRRTKEGVAMWRKWRPASWGEGSVFSVLTWWQSVSRLLTVLMAFSLSFLPCPVLGNQQLQMHFPVISLLWNLEGLVFQGVWRWKDQRPGIPCPHTVHHYCPARTSLGTGFFLLPPSC